MFDILDNQALIDACLLKIFVCLVMERPMVLHDIAESRNELYNGFGLT